MTRTGFLVFLLLIFLKIAFPLAEKAGAGETMRVRVGLSRSPASLPVLRVIESDAMGPEVTLLPTVWYGPEQLIAMVQNGGTQLFSLPLTVAARLRQRGFAIKLTNVNTWGGIRLITSDPTLREWKDLKGKTLFLPKRNSPPDVLVRFFLEEADLDADRDLKTIRTSVTEMSQLLRVGRIESAVLTEPQATAALLGNPALREAIDLEKEWERVTGDGLPTLGFGGTAAFLDEHPELVRRFEREYQAALDWILAHPREAGALAEKHLKMKADIVTQALPRMGLRYRAAADSREQIENFFRVLHTDDPDLKGDGTPDDAFYWR